MGGETGEVESGWTIDTLRLYTEAMLRADGRFNEERDRRYTEVALEREKALKIKETADLAALQLAREIQTYKDEKANELRAQIENERGSYASKDDLRQAVEKIEVTLGPVANYVTAQQGGPRAITTGMLVTAVGATAGVVGLLSFLGFS